MFRCRLLGKFALNSQLVRPAEDLGMDGISYEASPLRVREDLVVAHQRAWQRLAAPGTWWKGRRRVAIAAEARNAAICRYCRDSKGSLSPYMTRGTHERTGNLPESIIEIIHQIATDPGRLTRAWFDRAVSGGISDGDQHSHIDLPLILAGGGAGQLRGGRHVRYPSDTPMANLLLAMLNKAGAAQPEHFGDSTGRLNLEPLTV